MMNSSPSSYGQAAAYSSSAQSPQQPTGNPLQPYQTQKSDSGPMGLLGSNTAQTTNKGAVITISTTTPASNSSTTQTETTPLTTPSSFHADSWMIYIGAAILAVVVIGFLVSTIKDKHSAF